VRRVGALHHDGQLFVNLWWAVPTLLESLAHHRDPTLCFAKDGALRRLGSSTQQNKAICQRLKFVRPRPFEPFMAARKNEFLARPMPGRRPWPMPKSPPMKPGVGRGPDVLFNC